MLAKLFCGATVGVDAELVEVEVHLARGLTLFQIVGLPDGAVREARMRVPAAIAHSGWKAPRDKITVNLAPADLRKDGAGFDLAIAAGILLASSKLDPVERDLGRYLFWGELGLDGSVRPVRGTLPVARLAARRGLSGIVVARQNAREAAHVDGLEVVPVASLSAFAAWARGAAIEPLGPDRAPAREAEAADFAEVRGQEVAKRALEVAAAGGHNVVMVGPPGSGKSMLARRVAGILPAMTRAESLEVTQIYSVSGALSGELVRRRPFRSPHHSISAVGLIGGGAGAPRPGEVSLAHRGVLFLDELPEFKRSALETLRQPLEEGEVTINRSLMTLTYPGRVMLVAAMNPCRCGYFGYEGARPCACTLEAVRSYRARVSGPLMDRIDLHVEVGAIPYAALRSKGRGRSSAEMRGAVERARAVQRARQGEGLNAAMGRAAIERYCALDARGHELLGRAVERFGVSARGADRVVKLARTIADLEGLEAIETSHIAEALSYRALDRCLDARAA